MNGETIEGEAKGTSSSENTQHSNGEEAILVERGSSMDEKANHESEEARLLHELPRNGSSSTRFWSVEEK